MNQLLLLILGIFLSVIGIVNISGNISTIHAYNRRNVKEEDVPKYGKAVGTGTLIIGISLALAYLVTLWNESIPDAIVLPAITIGLAFILYGQIKYNHGIFYPAAKSAPEDNPSSGALFHARSRARRAFQSGR